VAAATRALAARAERFEPAIATDPASRRTLPSMGLPVIGSTRPWSRWHVTALVAAALSYA